MPKSTARKVQTYLSHSDPIDIEINDFLSRSSRGRRASAIRDMLYIAWVAIGSMSRAEFESRFPTFDYDAFRKRYPTSRPRSTHSAEPVIEQTNVTARSQGGQKPATKRLIIKPPTAK